MELEILHAARGDKKKKIDTSTPAGRKEAATIIEKLIKGGTAIFLEREKMTLRVKKYDPKLDKIIVEVTRKGKNQLVSTRADKAKTVAVAPVAGGSDDEETVLFVTNGDGTVNCAWCGERFNADLAVPDNDDDPICPGCYSAAQDEEL